MALKFTKIKYPTGGYVQLEVNKRRKYATVALDIIHADILFTPAGSRAIGGIFGETFPVLKSRATWTSICGNVTGHCFTVIRDFPVERADEIANKLMEIVNTEGNVEPMRVARERRRAA
jgi:hypothetical protein